jgi:regulation of enolase protein 1 (concanavalin A-like superfamily)
VNALGESQRAEPLTPVPLVIIPLQKTIPTVIHKALRIVAVMILAVALRPHTSYAQSLPAGWQSGDVGAVGTSGSDSGDLAALTVDGAGADVWGTADAFHFVYTTLTGDGSVVTQVTSEEYVADWTKAGVMMRETLAPGSKQASMFVSAGKGLAFQRRLATSGVSTSTSGGSGKAPYFVKLTRTANTFSASASADGANWTTVASDTIVMASTINVGVVVSSHVASSLATVTFASTAVAKAPVTTGTTTETIVFMRHGEKPAAGYGQLTCQGLQRALALPTVLTGAFGSPQAIFAPNPTTKVPDSAGSFYYVRPLATIEPTAIRAGLPVNTQYGYTDRTGLQNALLSSAFASATVFVAWEHLELQAIVQNIMTAYGSGVTVPAWPSADFDSLYVVRVTNASGVISAQFEHDYEGLNNLPTTCPN